MSEHSLDLGDAPSDLLLDEIVAAVRDEAAAFVRRCEEITGLARSTATGSDHVSGERGAITELAFLLRLTDSTAQSWWMEAAELTRRPLVHAALLTGRCDLSRGRLLLSELAALDPALADSLEAGLLADTRTIDRRPGELRRWLQRQAIRRDPAGAAARRREASTSRTGIRYRPLTDGLAEAVLTGPAQAVLGLMRNLDRLAPPADPEDDRTHGELMFATAIGAVQRVCSEAGIGPVPIELHLEVPVMADSYRVHPDHAQPEPVVLRLTPEGLEALHRARVILTDPVRAGVSPDRPAVARRSLSSSDARSHSAGRDPDGKTSVNGHAAGNDPDDRGRGRGHGHPPVGLPAGDVPTLVGYGPADPEHAAELLFDFVAASHDDDCPDSPADRPVLIRRLLDEPVTGICAVDARALRPEQLHDALPQPPPPTSRYRPTAAHFRVGRARDLTCTAPGCARISRQCDLDHLTPHPRGATTMGNLAPKCRHHHTLKHQDWTVTRDVYGVETWISPRGHRYLR